MLQARLSPVHGLSQHFPLLGKVLLAQDVASSGGTRKAVEVSPSSYSATLTFPLVALYHAARSGEGFLSANHGISVPQGFREQCHRCGTYF